MAIANKINFAALTVKTVDSEKRAITNTRVARPTRDILAVLNEQARKSAWQAVMADVAASYGTKVSAKGAVWLVNHDECARALRVNYNLIQPDYFENGKVTTKLDKDGSRELWNQIYNMLQGDKEDKELPVYLDETDGDND